MLVRLNELKRMNIILIYIPLHLKESSGPCCCSDNYLNVLINWLTQLVTARGLQSCKQIPERKIQKIISTCIFD